VRNSPKFKKKMRECICSTEPFYSPAASPRFSSEDQSPWDAAAFPTPNEDLCKIGWHGNITRPEAELKLSQFPVGTFLTRWSANSKSFVLSYSKSKKEFIHCAFIRPKRDGSLEVEYDNCTVVKYCSLDSFIQMQKTKGAPLGQSCIAIAKAKLNAQL